MGKRNGTTAWSGTESLARGVAGLACSAMAVRAARPWCLGRPASRSDARRAGARSVGAWARLAQGGARLARVDAHAGERAREREQGAVRGERVGERDET
jgi:hypothetical protein